ncbi:response regulator [Oceanobacillus sp. CAU 1775]
MILIADDSKFMRTYLKQILHKHGFTNFVEASNGKEAIQLFNLLKPRITLLDIIMPEIDGLEALQEIKKINSEAKVIMCSSLATNENKKQAIDLGASDFVIKPFFEDLNQIISRTLAEPGGDTIEYTIF